MYRNGRRERQTNKAGGRAGDGDDGDEASMVATCRTIVDTCCCRAGAMTLRLEYKRVLFAGRD